MKNLFSLSLLLLLLTAFISQAKIWRVNNNAGINADFATAQAAHDAATAADTIFLEPSATEYSVTATKALVWMGLGVQIGSNYPEYFTASSQTKLRMSPSGFVDESFFIGLMIFFNSSISYSFNNVVFDNCEFSSSSFRFSGNNNKFTKCFSRDTFNPSSGNGIIINNCIFTGFLSIQSTFTNALVSNCIFDGQLNLNNTTLTNCINIYTGTVTLNFCNFSNNIDARTGETAFGTANGNIGDVTQADIFEDISSSKSIYKYQLKAGGPAINAGFDGTDIGAFGGFDPIIYPGRPGIPFINNLLTTGIGNDNTALKVNISVESGN